MGVGEQKGTHSLQVKKGSEWLCISSFCQTELNITFLSNPGRTSRKQTPQWATREPPESQMCRENNQQAQLYAIKSRTSAQARKQTKSCTQKPPQPMDQKGKNSDYRVLRGMFRETTPRGISYTRLRLKRRMLSNTQERDYYTLGTVM